MIVDRDMGYRDVMQRLLGTEDSDVLVGILAEDGATIEEGESLNLAGIAAVNEFGSEDGHTPERSYLRSTVDEKRTDYGARLQKIVESHVDGKEHLDDGLAKLGAVAVRDVQTKIRTLRTPPNAESTVEAKGSSNPLIDTGRLRQSIHFEVRK